MAIQPGSRNQFNTGFQQSVGKFLLIDADYFWKFTRNAFDFSTLLIRRSVPYSCTTPSWMDDGRVSTTTCMDSSILDIRAYEARYFFRRTRSDQPGTPLSGSVFRIDHDQVFQSTVSLRYQRRIT